MAQLKRPGMKPGKHRNRNAGHGYERVCRDLFVKIGFPHVVTSRSENRKRDGEGVDLVNSDEAKNGRLSYNVQCKNSTNRVNYHSLLESMPQDGPEINVILHKYTSRSQNPKAKGNVFNVMGTYAILTKRDFLRMVETLVIYKASLDNALKLRKEARDDSAY